MQTHIPTDFLCHTALCAIPPRCWCCSTSLAGQMLCQALLARSCVGIDRQLNGSSISVSPSLHHKRCTLFLHCWDNHTIQSFFSIFSLPAFNGRCCGYLRVFSLPQADPDSVLALEDERCLFLQTCLSFITVLQKQMICSLALLGRLCGAGHGDHFELQPHLGLSEDPQGLPPRRIVYILPRAEPILSSPAEAVADPGGNSSVFSCLNSPLITLLVTEWVCDPALGDFSPPDPTVLQCSIHLVAPTT